MNIIADVAGQYDTLLALVRKMPDEPILLVGDLVDRGPDSKKVVQWVMDNEQISALYGNHEAMMVGAIEGKGPALRDWLYNGGKATINSYGLDGIPTFKDIMSYFPIDHYNYLKDLPLTYKEKGLFVSHAPWSPFAKKEYEDYKGNDLRVHDHFLIWNRNTPIKRKGEFQIYGHNSDNQVMWTQANRKSEPWAACIDTSRAGILTGMHWPSKIIYQQEYIK